jgi:hypothetical protein
MKRLFLAGSVALLSFGYVTAQDLEAIKTQILLRQFKAAKTAIDKAVTVEKLAKKPETWAMKSGIYASLATDPTTPKEQVDGLFAESESAIEKYKQIDPQFALLLKDNAYSTGPVSLYSYYFKKGVEGFNEKDWNKGFKNFASSVDISDFLILTKITTIKMDTTSILYAGASAQNMKDDANAIKYFSRLANEKIAGKDYEFMYQFLSNYYMNQKDDVNFAKYVTLGKSLYPESKYFPAVEEDYANMKDPYFINMTEGEALFAKLYPKDEKDTPQGDVTEMENKMIAAFNKVAEVKADKAGLAFTNIANHYVNKGVGINKQINAVNDEIKNVNRAAKPDKNGKLPPVPKELLAKREALNAAYNVQTDLAIVNYEKAADAYTKKASLENIEKQAYKNSVSFLIDLNAEKKSNLAKSKPAESAKYAAQEKKWNDLYSKIK